MFLQPNPCRYFPPENKWHRNGIRSSSGCHTLCTVYHVGNAILIERIEFTDGFRRQFVDTAQTNGTPRIALQADVGSAIPCSVRVIKTFRLTGCRFEPVFQLKGGFHTAAKIFHTAEAQTAADVFAHFYILTGFLDETGVNDTVDGHIGLCMSHAGSGTQDCQCY